MGFAMGLFWLVPVLVAGLLVWLLVSLLKDVPRKQHK